MAGAVPVLTIDGPSGSGKGTIARELAERLGWHRLDSGALYRSAGLAAQGAGIALDDAEALARLAAGLELSFSTAAGTETVQLDGTDVTDAIRSEEAGRAASEIAALPTVRTALLGLQRAFARAPGLVADGRDMGTVVFPDATFKLFLTASAEERALRRYKQLKEKGIDVSLRDLSRGIAERDQRDASRTVAPLKPADDAKVLDSTDLSPADVVRQVLGWLREMDVRDADRKSAW
jgi:cytidylate kinase